jgi:hypothetical protein
MTTIVIRNGEPADFAAMLAIINDAEMVRVTERSFRSFRRPKGEWLYGAIRLSHVATPPWCDQVPRPRAEKE